MKTLLLRPILCLHSLFAGLLLTGLSACNHNQSGTGAQKRLHLMVGEIREISLAGTDSTLTGTSDNSEVVDVSPKQTVPSATGSTKAAGSGQAVFLIKGVTIGTARVVFAAKSTGSTGEGQPRRMYVVQVTSK